MVIFHSYVKLPNGISMSSLSIKSLKSKLLGCTSHLGAGSSPCLLAMWDMTWYNPMHGFISSQVGCTSKQGDPVGRQCHHQGTGLRWSENARPTEVGESTNPNYPSKLAWNCEAIRLQFQLWGHCCTKLCQTYSLSSLAVESYVRRCRKGLGVAKNPWGRCCQVGSTWQAGKFP